MRLGEGRIGVKAIVAGMLSIFATSSCVGVSTPDQQTRSLLHHWSGGNISRLSEPERKRFQSFVNTRLVKHEKLDYNTMLVPLIFENRGDAYVWPFLSGPSAGYLIVLNPTSTMVPSAAHAWIFVVNKDGGVLSRQDFDIGWRMEPKAASFETRPWLSSKVLVQEIQPGMTSAPPLKILIAFDGLRPVTIKVETLDGSLHRMEYWAPNFVVGPKYEPPTVTTLNRVLQSGTDVQQLEALTWLNGEHSRTSDNRPNYAHEDVTSQERFAAAIKSPRIASAVIALRGSKNPYIRDVATQIPLGKGIYTPPWWN